MRVHAAVEHVLDERVEPRAGPEGGRIGRTDATVGIHPSDGMAVEESRRLEPSGMVIEIVACCGGSTT